MNPATERESHERYHSFMRGWKHGSAGSADRDAHIARRLVEIIKP